MAQMTDADVYAVAASTSEIKLIQISTFSGSTSGGAKQTAKGATCLQKSSTLVEHRREVIAIAFDGTICASIAMDKQLVLTRIIGDSCQTKVIHAFEVGSIAEDSQVAVLNIEGVGAHENEQIYVAVSTASSSFQVWHLTMDHKSQMQILQKTVQSGPTEVLNVKEDSAHNGEQINLMHFVKIGESHYLATSA